MRDSEFKIETIDDAHEALRVLRLAGPLTIHTVFQFQSAVRDGGSKALVLDLSGVPYMDSAGLGGLVGALVAAQKTQRKLVLVGINERVKALMDMSHVSPLFPSYPTVKEAAESLR